MTEKTTERLTRTVTSKELAAAALMLGCTLAGEGRFPEAATAMRAAMRLGCYQPAELKAHNEYCDAILANNEAFAKWVLSPAYDEYERAVSEGK